MIRDTTDSQANVSIVFTSAGPLGPAFSLQPACRRYILVLVVNPI
jgi:hypothetical protein